MKRLLSTALSSMLAFATAAVAGERTVTLAVDNMTCASCPYIVKKAMEGVPGVASVDVSLESKTAVVTFDDARTTPDAVAQASASMGFPARAVRQGG